jgi:hypothetical protein
MASDTFFLLQYDRRLVMPWLVDNAMICGLLFLVVVGGAITCFIVTASRISGDLTTITYGFITMASGAIAVGNTGHSSLPQFLHYEIPFCSYKN